MEYVYAALLIHKAGKQVTEQSVKKVLEAAGAKVDEARVKALIAALEGVNIDESIKEAATMHVATPAQAVQSVPVEQKKEAPKEDKKSEEQAAAGLASLFG